ncbi:maltase 1-like [Macrosteles quadrilineatus]|uniref:maltase 1-like n=1 Tax=Macrosteles quadrilineatus TaxID=74068 RepID=UPI0023E141B0|nr:maltase 1-like [Macrosteles quadrilineatus]
MASYFKEIGVTAVWLSPIFTSPMADFGYDISNFTDIDPLFGTIEDFEELVATFRELDIKILLDFVPNHSSNEHPWFLKSIKNDTDYKDFYVWRNPKYDINGTRLPPNNWISVFSGSAWEWVPERGQYYLRQFAIQQPDLDYRNPAVKGNMTAVINFWLDKGVDGFRMDAVAHCFEAANFTDEPAKPGTPGNTYETLQHIYTQNQPETYAMLKEWAEMLHERSQQDGRQRVMILEVYYPTPLAVTYYGSGNASLMFPFNFNLLTYGNQSVRAPFIKSLIDDWIFYAPKGSQYNWAVGNHDNIRAANRYGTEMVDSINLLTGVLPGIKVVYNGEEMGMENTYVRWDQTVDPSGIRLGPYRYLEGSRDPQRTPMQWDDTPSSGFSQDQDTWLPINPNYWWLNVEAQRNSKTSHLKVFQTLMQARKDPVLQYGGVDLYAPDNDTLVIKR